MYDFDERHWKKIDNIILKLSKIHPYPYVIENDPDTQQIGT